MPEYAEIPDTSALQYDAAGQPVNPNEYAATAATPEQ